MKEETDAHSSDPEEVTKTIYFLCSDQPSYINGSEIHIISTNQVFKPYSTARIIISTRTTVALASCLGQV